MNANAMTTRVVALALAVAGCGKDAANAPAAAVASGSAATVASGSAAAVPDASAAAVGSGSAAAVGPVGSGAAPGSAMGDPEVFLGKWKLDAVRTKDGPVAKDKLEDGGMVWDFHGDGTLAMHVWKGKEERNATAHWSLEANSEGATIVALDEDGQVSKVKMERDGDKLQIAATTSSVVMTFVPAAP